MGDVDVFTKLSHLLEKSDISKWENSGNYNNNNLNNNNIANTITYLTAEFDDIFTSLQTQLTTIDQVEVKKTISVNGSKAKTGNNNTQL